METSEALSLWAIPVDNIEKRKSRIYLVYYLGCEIDFTDVNFLRVENYNWFCTEETSESSW